MEEMTNPFRGLLPFEEQHAGVAEQREGESQPLLHSRRVRADAPLGDRAEADAREARREVRL